MLFAAAALLFVTLMGFAFLEVSELKRKIRKLEGEVEKLTANGIRQTPSADSETESIDSASEARFSSSLLSLSRVHLQARRDSPRPELDESSSLVSVRHAQSKNPAQES